MERDVLKKRIREVFPERLLKPTDVAYICQVDKRTVLRWAEQGKLPKVVLDEKIIRFRMRDLVEFIEKRRK
ncbi:Helix-turn-helix domain-containing protein [Balnearium lithotrophicum]|uniref:Helix-turn-helix domain-containing protein n=1 Tax=Balnearium lithotrophicum TaxID=223788 RepID=A0A521CQ55_9BACT|nr:helix-turn-helix domain-containing protein [Balnearium lithotrophicum]SMO61536.1 Helix-turn-helix domain-containing protein [Balnearium lithotrophicum]